MLEELFSNLMVPQRPRLTVDFICQDIFDKPHFYEDKMSAKDVCQGKLGNCWFLSAVCAVANKDDLLEKVCCVRDEKVGIYGFVFHRGMFDIQIGEASHD